MPTPGDGNDRGIRFGRTAVRQVLCALTIVAIGVGLTYLVQVAKLASVMFEVFSGINATTDTAKNNRGDEAAASTESTSNWRDPDKTVVRLHRAYHWFSTTLVEAQSFGVHEHLEWTNEDLLDVTLDFGCLTHMSRPVEKAGSIRISYHFSDGGRALAKGCPD